MPAPLSETLRAEIEQAIRDGHGTVSCRGLAVRFGVSATTVRNVADRAGIEGAFARTQTVHATRARVADLADRRSRMAERLMVLAESIAGRLDARYEIVLATQHEIEHVWLEAPPLKEVKDGMAAVGTALARHVDLIKFDTKPDADSEAASLADRLAALLQLDQGNDEVVADGYPTPLPPPPSEYEDDDGYAPPDMEAGQ